MATYTPVSKIIGTTGASGGQNFQTAVAAQITAVAAAVTTAQGVTGVIPQSITVSPCQPIFDTLLYELVSTVSYTVLS
jgi:hypothetical protein